MHSACQVFLGSLREAEVERINDRISQAIMETCLAMTIFREEFNVEFCAMFTVRSRSHDAVPRWLQLRQQWRNVAAYPLRSCAVLDLAATNQCLTCNTVGLVNLNHGLLFVPQILTFVKVFHWLVQDRVDYMETTPATSRLQHLRIVSFMGVLLVGLLQLWVTPCAPCWLTIVRPAAVTYMRRGSHTTATSSPAAMSCW